MTHTRLIYIYLDYRNNFLSIEGYASYYNLPMKLALELIHHAKDIYNLEHGIA